MPLTLLWYSAVQNRYNWERWFRRVVVMIIAIIIDLWTLEEVWNNRNWNNLNEDVENEDVDDYENV
jgi:uncharacterized membrane protein YqjE